ncbi:MAG: hypothetical protein ACUVUC_02120 [Thermoguttaceae bacterium]
MHIRLIAQSRSGHYPPRDNTRLPGDRAAWLTPRRVALGLLIGGVLLAGCTTLGPSRPAGGSSAGSWYYKPPANANSASTKAAQKKRSWWDSLFGSKDPRTPRSIKEWMKLPQVKLPAAG